MNLMDVFSNAVEDAVAEKLAALSADQITVEMSKEAATRRKNKSKRRSFGMSDVAARVGTTATGALISSVLGDIRSAPVDFAKKRLYALVDSAASHLYR